MTENQDNLSGQAKHKGSAREATLQSKISRFIFWGVMVLLLCVSAISLYAFRAFAESATSEHLQTAGEIVRLHLTESMLNNTIDKRGHFFSRLLQAHNLRSVKVVRSPEVVAQFGVGLDDEQNPDALEKQVMTTGIAAFQQQKINGEQVMRAVIPYTAPPLSDSPDEPNCLNCHLAKDGSVLGVVSMSLSIDSLVARSWKTLAVVCALIALVSLFIIVVLRRMVAPISTLAANIEQSVQQAAERGNFKQKIDNHSATDELGKIADSVNKLFLHLDHHFEHIGHQVARLTQRQAHRDENLVEETSKMINSLVDVSIFKRTIEKDLTKQDVYMRLSRILCQVFGITEFSIYEISDDKKSMHCAVVNGVADGICRWCDGAILKNPSTCRLCLTACKVDAIEQPGLCTAFRGDIKPDSPWDRSHICLPISQTDGIACIVQLVVRECDFDKLQKNITQIAIYLREMAPVLEGKRLLQNLRNASLHDALTGIKNRRFLEEYADTIIANVQRKQSHLSILTLDLDFFKSVNDSYGHDAGDVVLKQVAQTIRRCVRASDFFIRTGGEEFLILLQDTVGKEAEQTAENIRNQVAQLTILIDNNVELHKTVSIGLVDYPDDVDDFWQAVKCADVALYQAKNAGRNRIVRFLGERA